jgi:hypothetical protein
MCDAFKEQMASPPSFSGRIAAADYIIPHSTAPLSVIRMGPCDFSQQTALPTLMDHVLVTGAQGVVLTNGSANACSVTTDATGQMLLGCAVGTGVVIPSAVVSTSATSGALVVGGGVGVAQNLYVGGNLHVPTTGGTSTALNYYENTSAAPFSYALLGALNAGSLTGQFVRIGNAVTLIWNPVTPAANVAAALLTVAAASVPARFRPTTPCSAVVLVVDNSTTSIGSASVLADGSISFALAAATVFTNAGNTGLLAGSLTYHV